jgi:hypothetical protein
MRENMSHSVHVWLVTAKILRPCQKMIEIPFPISLPNIRHMANTDFSLMEGKIDITDIQFVA